MKAAKLKEELDTLKLVQVSACLRTQGIWLWQTHQLQKIMTPVQGESESDSMLETKPDHGAM